MAHDGNQSGSRKPLSKRTDRAMELMWAESLTKAPEPPAAPAADKELPIDVELVPEEEIRPPAIAAPVDDGGPFIEAVLVEPPPVDDGGPFIEAVLVEPPPMPEPPPVGVADWLNDILTPAPVLPPAPPPTSATPDWLAELADTEAAPQPAPPPTTGATPDWLNDLP